MQQGGGSKDTWVRGSVQPVAGRRGHLQAASTELVRDDTNLSSRMAENLLWFGRNAERCDNIARLLRVALNSVFEDAGPSERGPEWDSMMALCQWFALIPDEAELNAPPPEPAESEEAEDMPEPVLPSPSQAQSQSQSGAGTQTQSQTQSPIASQAAAAIAAVPVPEPAPEPLRPITDIRIEAALLNAVITPDVPGLAMQKQNLYNTASHLRERLSIDNWRALNRLMQRPACASALPSPAEAMTILDDTATALMTLAGFALDGMNRDRGWRFLSLGRRLERLQFQSLMLQEALSMDEEGSLDWMLELSDSIVTYRARYRAQPEWLQVLDLLVLDETNPRSVRFQLEGVLQGLDRIGVVDNHDGADTMRGLTDELLALDPATHLVAHGAVLRSLLARIDAASKDLADRISLQFFSYTGKPVERRKAQRKS